MWMKFRCFLEYLSISCNYVIFKKIDLTISRNGPERRMGTIYDIVFNNIYYIHLVKRESVILFQKR
jgi:hypothetical protein